MRRPSPQALVVMVSLLGGTGATWWVAARSSTRDAVEAGFWFEEISLGSGGRSSRDSLPALPLTPPLTEAELRRIEHVAHAEVARAFAALRLRLTDSRSARFRVAVVPQLQDLRFDRPVDVAGQSRAVPGFGGSGAVSFWFLANGAVVHAPPGADRQTIVDAIGRGIGRTAVHELTHQLLPKAPIHDSQNAASYEHRSAARREHYYGDVDWDTAWPLLVQRLGRR